MCFKYEGVPRIAVAEKKGLISGILFGEDFIESEVLLPAKEGAWSAETSMLQCREGGASINPSSLISFNQHHSSVHV